MNCRSLKLIREDLEKIGAITNKAEFLAALPILVEALVKVSQMRRTLKSVGDLPARSMIVAVPMRSTIRRCSSTDSSPMARA